MHRTSFPQKRPDSLPRRPHPLRRCNRSTSAMRRAFPVRHAGTPARRDEVVGSGRGADEVVGRTAEVTVCACFGAQPCDRHERMLRERRSNELVGSGRRSANGVGTSATEMTRERSARATGSVRGWDPEPGVRERGTHAVPPDRAPVGPARRSHDGRVVAAARPGGPAQRRGSRRDHGRRDPPRARRRVGAVPPRVRAAPRERQGGDRAGQPRPPRRRPGGGADARRAGPGERGPGTVDGPVQLDRSAQPALVGQPRAPQAGRCRRGG